MWSSFQGRFLESPELRRNLAGYRSFADAFSVVDTLKEASLHEVRIQVDFFHVERRPGRNSQPLQSVQNLEFVPPSRPLLNQAIQFRLSGKPALSRCQRR